MKKLQLLVRFAGFILADHESWLVGRAFPISKSRKWSNWLRLKLGIFNILLLGSVFRPKVNNSSSKNFNSSMWHFFLSVLRVDVNLNMISQKHFHNLLIFNYVINFSICWYGKFTHSLLSITKNCCSNNFIFFQEIVNQESICNTSVWFMNEIY